MKNVFVSVVETFLFVINTRKHYFVVSIVLVNIIIIRVKKEGDFMGGYHWEQIVMLLLDRMESMKAHEDEMNHRIDELMAENVRLTQLLRDKEYDEGAK